MVVLRKPTNSEISAVRDGVHYTITHSNDAVTVAAIDTLCRSARFPSSRQASDAIARMSDPAQQALAKALRAGSADEARELLNRAGIPSISTAPGITRHDLGSHGHTNQNSSIGQELCKEPRASTPQTVLLKKLDGGGNDSREAEDALVAMGDEAIDDLLQSVAEINGRMNGSIREAHLDPVAEMSRLERRVQLMERMRNPMTLKALFDALADSALAVEAYTQKRDAAYEQGDMMIPMMAEMHLESAKSLNKATINALV